LRLYLRVLISHYGRVLWALGKVAWGPCGSIPVVLHGSQFESRMRAAALLRLV